jgi:NADPH2:quinone reductase
MRSMQVDELGGPLRLRESPVPTPDVGEVLISTTRSGVNYPDLLLTQGLYQARPPLPFAPGFEVAGTVTAVGSEVAGVAVGDRVMAFVPYGGYATDVVAAANVVFGVPDAVSDEQAAVLPIAYGTAQHALIDRAALQSGETVVVLGASGGVGIATIQVAGMIGAEVIACVGADWKMDFARDAGADHVIDYVTEDVRSRVLEITGGKGADVVVDPVGGDAADAALRYLAWRGRLLIIGFTSGRIPDIPANRLLLKGASAVGVFWGQFAQREPQANRRNFEALLGWVADDSLQPMISQRVPLERAAEVLTALAERRVVGKIVLETR